MLWSDFYDEFWDWTDAIRCTHITSLEDIGTGEEIVEVIYEIEDPKVRAQLVRKAIKLGAKFTSDDFQNLTAYVFVRLDLVLHALLRLNQLSDQFLAKRRLCSELLIAL